jgi:hypothetical protein
MADQSKSEIFACSATLMELGSGELCSACSKNIELGEVEYEVTIRTTVRTSLLRFHARCYAIWSGAIVD